MAYQLGVYYVLCPTLPVCFSTCTMSPNRPNPDFEATGALVARGKRDVVQHESARSKKFGQKPSTSKALILRDANHNVLGSGQTQLFRNRLFGQEKLFLLAGTFAL
jgi:hypothetical protein